jgi:hypothetical protein
MILVLYMWGINDMRCSFPFLVSQGMLLVWYIYVVHLVRACMRASPPFEQTNSSVQSQFMVRGIKPKEGCMVIPPARGENIQYVHWEETHAWSVRRGGIGDQSTEEGDTISFEGCACSPLKKGRGANSSKKNVKRIPSFSPFPFRWLYFRMMWLLQMKLILHGRKGGKGLWLGGGNNVKFIQG